MRKKRKAADRASVLVVGRVFIGCLRVTASGQAEPGWGKNVFY